MKIAAPKSVARVPVCERNAVSSAAVSADA